MVKEQPYSIVVERCNEMPTDAQPYKYGGKELDRRFGYDSYDFEARVYDPALGRFTQPDPMAWDTPEVSPYVYCAANPIRYIDPTGMDYYNVDKHGNITLSSKNDDDFDRLISSTNNDRFIDVEKSFINSKETKIVKLNTQNGVQTGVVEFFISKDSERVYEFMMSNTDVEWSLIEYVDNDNNYCQVIGTQKHESDASMEVMANKIVNNGGTIVSAGHIHPSGDTTLTLGDITVAKNISSKSPNACFYISTKETTRYYDTNSKPGELPEVIIFFKK